MQYGMELYPYQRVNKKDKEGNGKKEVRAMVLFKFGFYFTAAFLISRVLLINQMAPFGVAFLIAITAYKEEKIALVAACGTLLGYLTLYYNIRSLGAYFIVIATVASISYVTHEISVKNKLMIMFGSILIEFFMFSFYIYKFTLGVSLLQSFLELACIFPLYFIIEYSLVCIKDINKLHIFSNEEIICMAITISLVVAGTWGINIVGISVRNLFALFFILIVSYTNGSGVGTASGVAMGVITGMGSNSMLIFVTMYGTCGLVAGIFKESGKWMTGMAYAVIFFIIKIYSNVGSEFKLIEILIVSLIFFAVPNKIYEKIALEFDLEKKQRYITNNYVDKVRNIWVGRLDNFSDVLYSMSDILNSLVNNDKLVLKSKSSALIENLADRVCSNCDMNSMCWKREIHYTYTAFGELIESYQDKKGNIPKELTRKCIKRTVLQRNTEDIVNNYIINEMWRSRLSEGRELLATQINNMADSIGEIVQEFNSDIKFNNEQENVIRRFLDKNNIKYTDIICFDDKRDRVVIKLSLFACGGSQMCVKRVLPLLNEVVGKPMCVSDEGCVINPKNNLCSVTFEETPKYHIASYVARECKEGEQYNGDSYTFGKLGDGTYMNIISDGMGSGPEAGQESQAAIDLIEKFTNAGFSKSTAIHTVNSIMTIKFSEDEKFSTVDLNSIDLYSGQVDFMKVGAVASFIKSGENIEIIKSKTLPIGVLDKVDIDVTKKTVKNGDLIVMVSDGVLDYNNDVTGKEEWIASYLKKHNSYNPKELAEGLISKAKELNGGKVADDMTVIISKIYSLY